MNPEKELKELKPVDIVSYTLSGESHGVFNLERIKAIQLDAFKAGAEWAAGIRNDGSALFKRDEILSASSNLKEIPK